MKILTPSETTQMSRHLLMPEIGEAGQLKLKQSRVLIVGLGGLGSPVALYLAAAGIGTIGLIDHDVVELSNLQRQILFTTENLGQKKATLAGKHLKKLNPNIEIQSYAEELNYENVLKVISQYDVVVDGTDNFATRFLINDACIVAKKINVHASVFKFEGQVSVLAAPGGPCYRCMFPQAPPAGMMPACGEIGVLGAIPGVVGCLQATETIKVLLSLGTPLIGSILHIDSLRMNFTQLKVDRNPECPVCSGPISTLPGKENYGSALHCESSTAEVKSLSAEALAKLIESGRVTIIDVRETHERNQDLIPNSLHLPLKQVDNVRSLGSTESTVVIYCAKGVRGEEATKKVQTLLLDKEVLNLKGGLTEFRKYFPASRKRN